MTLEAAAQLLTSALMLLQAVSANPALPQSVRDGTQSIAQTAITEVTRAIAKPSIDASVPSCRIVADKYNYYAGEIVVFNWTSVNAQTVEFIPDASGKSAFDLPNEKDVGAGGQYRVVAKTKGYPFITMRARAGERSGTCSAMVNVY